MNTTDFATSISRLLPGGRLTDLAARIYCRWFNPLYELNSMVSGVEVLGDDVLRVEFKDGAVFYCPKAGRPSMMLEYGHPRKLDKIRGYTDFGPMFWMLEEQFIQKMHQKQYRLKSGDVVVDAGAHIGTFTVLAARTVGTEGKVIAFEPEAKNLDFLRRNVEANDLGNVVIIPKGLWSQPDKLRFNLSEFTGEHSFATNGVGSEFAEVEVDALDNVLQELGIPRVDFIKMDIEAAEIEALKGMEATLRDSDVKMVVETHYSPEGPLTHRVVVPQLKQRGFEVHREGVIVYARKRAR